MKFYVDLHIHSRYSRATSSELNPENLYLWARKKGIGLVGTGDCVHPGWLTEIRENCREDGSGLLDLKPGRITSVSPHIPSSCKTEPKFILTTEISGIYKRDGKVRKVHNVICLPSLKAAKRLAARLEKIGNIRSDGRPILGLDSRDLLSTALDIDPRVIFIPAHIWTPWFSALGSKSGFDSIEECFGDMTRHIYAVETGLSSDPPMNWRLSSLDSFALVSSSDAHSPSKLGRECTVFDTEFSYDGIYTALSDPANSGLSGTMEFFPEEGKYHYDGHRKCNVRCTPKETIGHKGLCPICGKPLTIGVMARVEELADREEGRKGLRSRPFFSLIPLQEIIADSLGCGPGTRGVLFHYDRLLHKCADEFTVLSETDIGTIESYSNSLIAEGVRRMRSGEVKIAAGYDGEFGTVHLFTEKERGGKKYRNTLANAYVKET